MVASTCVTSVTDTLKYRYGEVNRGTFKNTLSELRMAVAILSVNGFVGVAAQRRVQRATLISQNVGKLALEMYMRLLRGVEVGWGEDEGERALNRRPPPSHGRSCRNGCGCGTTTPLGMQGESVTLRDASGAPGWLTANTPHVEMGARYADTRSSGAPPTPVQERVNGVSEGSGVWLGVGVPEGVLAGVPAGDAVTRVGAPVEEEVVVGAEEEDGWDATGVT